MDGQLTKKHRSGRPPCLANPVRLDVLVERDQADQLGRLSRRYTRCNLSAAVRLALQAGIAALEQVGEGGNRKL